MNKIWAEKLKQAQKEPTVLLFNLPEDSRTRRILSYLEADGVKPRRVEREEFGQPLAHLLGMPGFSEMEIPTEGCAFRDEMLVMCGFTQERLERFLAFFKEERLPGVALKAVLTPTNAAWNAVYLHEHLARERAAVLRQER